MSLIDTDATRDLYLCSVISLWVLCGFCLMVSAPTLLGSDIPSEACIPHVTVFTTFAADTTCL